MATKLEAAGRHRGNIPAPPAVVFRWLRVHAVKFNLYSKSESVPPGSQLPVYEDFCFKSCKCFVGSLRNIKRVIECRVQIWQDPQHPKIMRREHKTSGNSQRKQKTPCSYYFFGVAPLAPKHSKAAAEGLVE